MEKSWTTDVLTDDKTGEHYIQFTEEQLAEAGLKSGDEVEWIDNKDGSWTLRKKKFEWVLVETINTFRERYMVQVPIGKSEWALDTVTMEEAKEFSQEHIGEQIISHRVVSEADALKLCDEDNTYTKSWTDEEKMNAYFTKWEITNGERS